MQKILGLLSILIILSSCGVPFGKDLKRGNRGETRQFSTTNPQFSELIKEFEKDGKEYKSDSSFVKGDVPVNFGDTEDEQFDGVCIIYSNGEREVLIKESWWKHASDTQKKLLVYHELGHCSLDRDHDESTVDINGHHYKLSIMNPIIPSTYSFIDDARKTGYLDELFNETKTQISAAYAILLNK